VIALKLRKKLDDTLACFRIVGAEDEIMLSTAQVKPSSSPWGLACTVLGLSTKCAALEGTGWMCLKNS